MSSFLTRLAILELLHQTGPIFENITRYDKRIISIDITISGLVRASWSKENNHQIFAFENIVVLKCSVLTVDGLSVSAIHIDRSGNAHSTPGSIWSCRLADLYTHCGSRMIVRSSYFDSGITWADGTPSSCWMGPRELLYLLYEMNYVMCITVCVFSFIIYVAE